MDNASDVLETAPHIPRGRAVVVMLVIIEHRRNLTRLAAQVWCKCCIILRYISLQPHRPPVGHGAATMSLLHWALSFVKACSCPHVNPNSFSYILHVVLGLPRFFFPGGVHLKATLGIRTCGIRRT